MRLDLTSLRSALAALEKSLGFLNSELAENADLREQFRAAAVQAFEFTHELAFKMLKRQLEQMAADPAAIDKMAYMDVVRSGAEAGLIADVARFRDYREKRNITSHTYDQSQGRTDRGRFERFSGRRSPSAGGIGAAQPCSRLMRVRASCTMCSAFWPSMCRTVRSGRSARASRNGKGVLRPRSGDPRR